MTLAESKQGFRLRVLRTTRHVEADIPGELLSLDTFYVGCRKGVGTVWHIAGCARRQIRVTRTRPRHAWTNGFVERVQRTISHEHWRIAFRRHDFTSCAALQRALDRYLRFYNLACPRRGCSLTTVAMSFLMCSSYVIARLLFAPFRAPS